jgi:hypothetical protein
VIVQLLLDALLAVLTLVLAAIPDVSMPAAASSALSSFATTLGAQLGGLDGMLPITEVGSFVGWVLGTYVPIVIAYHVAHWVWTHLPVIGNGG